VRRLVKPGSQLVGDATYGTTQNLPAAIDLGHDEHGLSAVTEQSGTTGMIRRCSVDDVETLN
jgi:hypothetical protein